MKAVSLPPYLLIANWGQNLAKNQLPPSQFEDSLATLCKYRNFNVYHIGHVTHYNTVNNLPGIDLSNHCEFPTDVFPADIQACQALGKKVLLTINPTDSMVSDDSTKPNYAVTVAQNIWNLFLGGQSTTRPFGAAVLDGIDIRIWNNNNVGVQLFVNTLRGLMGQNYLLSASPRCSFPDYIIGPQTFTNFSAFDYVVSYFIQSPGICGYAGNNPDGFWTSLGTWSNWTASLPTKPPLALGIIDWYTEAWDQGSTGDYIPPQDWAGKDLVPRMRSYTSFAGFALQDASYDTYNQPCVNDSNNRHYSDIVYQQLSLPPSQIGNLSTPTMLCVPKPTTFSATQRPTATATVAPKTPSSSPPCLGYPCNSGASRSHGFDFLSLALFFTLYWLI
ncbi:hypothetical protein HK101_006977 [Irineochytrium annulatum]|nr:hypothetical protein HK101_006977 [Irineochytrium annulatum]